MSLRDTDAFVHEFTGYKNLYRYLYLQSNKTPPVSGMSCQLFIVNVKQKSFYS